MGTERGDEEEGGEAGEVEKGSLLYRIERWYKLLAHPEKYVSHLAFYMAVFSIFFVAMLRCNSFYGPFLLLIDCVVAGSGRRGMQRFGRMALLSLTSFTLLWGHFLLALGLPTDSNTTRWVTPETTGISQGAIQYFCLRPTVTEVLLMMMIWALITAERVSLTARKEEYHWFFGFPRNYVRTRLTMTDRLRSPHSKRIRLARTHNAVHLLQRLLGVEASRSVDPLAGTSQEHQRTNRIDEDRDESPAATQEAMDATVRGGLLLGGTTTEEEDKRTVPYRKNDAEATLGMHRWKLIFYDWFPLFVLVLALLHSVYDATTTLSVFKLVSLFICLIYLHRIGDLPWHGNVWWCWLLRFHTTWALLRMGYNTPLLTNTRNVACGLRFLGLEPAEILLSTSAQVYTSCSGTPYTLADVVFHGIVIGCVWFQSANYDNAEYGIVLCIKHRREVLAAELGEHIREQRKKIIAHRKRMETERLEARRALLELIRKSRKSTTPVVAEEVENQEEPGAHTETMRPTTEGRTAGTTTTSPEPLSRRESPPPRRASVSPMQRTRGSTTVSTRELLQRHGSSRLWPTTRRGLLGSRPPLDTPRPRLTTGCSGNDLFDHLSMSLVVQLPGEDEGNDGESTEDTCIPSLGDLPQERSIVTTDPYREGYDAVRTEEADEEEEPTPVDGPLIRERTRVLLSGTLSEEGDNVLGYDKSPQPRSRAEKMKYRLIAFLGWWLRTVDTVIIWLDRHSISPAASRIQLPIRNRPWALLKALYRFTLSYTDMVCYLFFMVQFSLSPCVVAAILPVSIFVYAGVLNPRPHKNYWSFCLIYLQLLIAVKSVIKVAFCHQTEKGVAFTIMIGRTCTSDYYLIDTLMELLCVVAVLLHTDHLRTWGLWDDTELKLKYSLKDTPRGSPNFPRNSQSSFLTRTSREGTAQTHSDEPKGGGFFAAMVKNLTDPEQKVGVDRYKLWFTLEFLSLLYVFFAYYKLLGIESTFTEALSHSILPGGLAITLILLFSLIAFDRVIYLSRSIVAKYLYGCVATLFYHGFMVWWFNEQVQLNQTYYREDAYFLRGALPLAAVLYFAKCGFLYLGCAQLRYGFFTYTKHLLFNGNYKTPEFIVYYAGRLLPFVFDLKVILDWAATRTSLKMGYWLKLEDICHELYLVLVDRQDTKDVDEMKKDPARDPYPKRLKYPIGGLFFLLLSVILLFPLLLYSSFSPVIQQNSVTSLEVSLSLEGTPSFWQSGDRFVDDSLTGSADGNSRDKTHQSWQEGRQGGRTKWRGPCCVLNTTVTGLLERTRPSLVGMGLNRDTVQLLTANNYSSTTWTVSPPALERLLSVLNGNASVSLVLQIGIQSSVTTQSSTTKSYLRQELELSSEQQVGFSQLLQGNTSVIRLNALYTPFLFNYPGGDFQYFEQPYPAENTVDCYLGATAVREGLNTPRAQYFSLWCHTLFEHSNPSVQYPWNALSAPEKVCLSSDICPDYENNNALVETGTTVSPLPPSSNQTNFAISPLYVIVISPAALSASILQSIGIVAAYTTFVLAIGRVLRFVVTGGAFRVCIEDMEDPFFLVCLVEYMYIARAQRDFQLEYELYRQLVDTLRVTEVLERRTKLKQD